MTKNYILISFMVFAFLGFSQDEDPACMPAQKKVQKLIDAANAAPDTKTASENFAKAIEAAPDIAAPYFEFGMYAYAKAMEAFEKNPNPTAGEKLMDRSNELLLKAVERCTDFHSDMYYCLGVIAYSKGNKDLASKYFESFIKFNGANTKYSDDYAKKKTDVEQILKELKTEQELTSTSVPFNPQMVKNVSSADDEYFPMISPDNSFMFFTRKKDVSKNELGVSEGMTSNIREVFSYANWQEATKSFDTGKGFAAPFNQGDFDSYGAATMSVDNKELIICACKKTTVFNQPYMNCDLYSTTFNKVGPNPNDYEWSELINLGPKINAPNTWEGQPSMSADGLTLYFAANGPNTKDNDIFVVLRDPKTNEWGTPRPFTEVNTPGKDKSPFLHQDSETFYFVSSVSDEHKGIGGTDIFYMRQNEDGTWGEIKNIGSPINTKEDELGLFVSMDGQLAYFSSRQTSNWNIYGFELYEEARPKKVSIVKGQLNNPQGEAVENATIEVAYENGEKVEQVKVNGNDGKFAVIVKQEVPSDIIVSVKQEGKAFESKVITKETLASNKETKISDALAVKEMKVREPYTINDILYDYNSDVLSARSKFILREFARYLNENQSIQIAIQGHTDSDGEDAKNLDLSERRAKGVREYLVSLGVDESRLTSKGFGETAPKVANDTPANKAKNRRTDFLITGM